MKRVILFVLFLSAFVSLSSPAQNVNIGKPIGYGIEVFKTHYVCVAYRNFFSPPYFVIRSNRPDLFFQDITKVRDCLLEAKRYSENLKRYKNRKTHSYPRTFPNGINVFAGRAGTIHCIEFRNENNEPSMFEFSFPYLDNEDIKSLVQKIPLQACLKTTEPAVIPTSSEEIKL